ncbi:MAG TPA: C1 family peptidase [Pyrinomonadaceae bacterium]|nr:C1 family peptidase [Pyrinomonadaceae bacterium]
MKNSKLAISTIMALLLLTVMVPACRQTGTDQSANPPATQAPADYREREAKASPEIKARLAKLRQDIEANKRPFQVSYTSAMDQPLERLAGTRIPRDQPGLAAEVNKRAELLKAADVRSAVLAKVDLGSLRVVGCSATAGSFDWRRLNKVTPVKDQICGTCWDFTAMGAYEGSYALRNNSLVDTSEQYNLNCASAGSCAGGWWMDVFDYMIGHGTTTEAADPFTGNDSAACPTGMPLSFRAAAWGFVGPDLNTIPSPPQIKAALCEHGPLATAVMVDDAFQAYAGGVLDEHTTHFDWINHGVTIIGWDDSKNAWLIKNSWGPTWWGENGGMGTDKGYGWIAYNTNNIGIATAWVDATYNRYRLSADWFKIVQQQKFKFQPIPIPQ